MFAILKQSWFIDVWLIRSDYSANSKKTNAASEFLTIFTFQELEAKVF